MKKTQTKTVFYSGCFYGIVLLLCMFSQGCQSPRGELFEPLDKPLAWPGAPNPDRIRYVGQISTEEDLKREVSWGEGLANLIFGKKDIGILRNPYAIIADDQKLYIADASSGVVHFFDLAKRDYKQFHKLSGNEILVMPVGITFVDDKIYIVDSVLHKICVFDRNGNYIFSFGSERLKRPSGIAYCPDKEVVFVTDTARHTINVFTRSGDYIRSFGSRGLDHGNFNFPTHLWLDKQHKIYVSDTLNYRVQIFTCEGKFVSTFGEHGDRPGYFAHPSGVATDMSGNIYVTDRQFENFQVFDSKGQILIAIGNEGSGPGEFWLPGGLYIDNKNRLYIADSFNKRIQIFDILESSNNEN